MNRLEQYSARHSEATQWYLMKDASRLKNLSKPKLLEIIKKFDSELTTLSGRMERTRNELTAKSTLVSELREQLSFVKETNKLLSEELYKSHESFMNVKKSMEEELNQLKLRIAEDCSTNYSTILEDLKRERQALTESIAEKTRENNELIHENGCLSEKVRVMTESVEYFEEKIINIKNKNMALKDSLKIAQQKDSKKDEKIAELNSEISDLQQDILLIKQKYQDELACRQETHENTVKSYEIALENCKKELELNQNSDQFKEECKELKAKYT